MKLTLSTALFVVGVVGATSCTSILGTFKFDETGGTGGTAACTLPCTSDNDCGSLTGMCVVGKCNAGCCNAEGAPAGSGASALAQVPHDCKTRVCDGTPGGTTDATDATDTPTTLNVCNLAQCNGSTPQQVPTQPSPNTCVLESGGAGVCGDPSGLAGGKCVGCNSAADCPTPTDACSSYKCSANECVVEVAPQDTACTGTGVKTCDGAGNCVECNSPADCTGGYGCAAHMCVPASCSDKMKDGGETDVDCGGPSCAACAPGLACQQQTDCTSGYCDAGVCKAASCTDGVRDGDETGIDCGGSCTGKKCNDGEGCNLPSECASGVCTANVCKAPTCSDGVLNGDETDVDCGGSICSPCDVGKKCVQASDCATGVNGAASCSGGTCAFTCSSGYGDCDGAVGCETDITTKDHCGSCGTSCSAYCTSGACNDPVAAATSYGHTCALLQDSTVWCWGNNYAGQLGDGTTTTRLQPKKVNLPQAATAVFAGGGAGGYQTCAILADKTLRCWGSNASGQLGVGTTTSYYATPQTVMLGATALADVVQVALGQDHTCAVTTAQKLYCWGLNDNGQLGTGDYIDQTKPTLVTSGVTDIAAGSAHTCAIETDGKVHCWGYNGDGELGNGGTTSLPAPPTYGQLPGALKVAAGSSSTCARTSVGMYCWGDNSSGQLGIGSTTNQSSPQPVSLSGVTQISVGGLHAGAITSAGLYMWGGNTAGQVGDGAGVNRPSPVPIPLDNVAALSLGMTHSCAVTSNHHMFCWGLNDNGQLGTGTTINSSVPVAVAWP